MPFQKVEFEFPEPEEDNSAEIEVEPSSARDVDLSGGTPVVEKKPDNPDDEIEI